MEIGTSAVTLVCDLPEEKDTKIKRSRKAFLIRVGAVVGAVGFVIATGLLADQVFRLRKQIDSVNGELFEIRFDQQVQRRNEENSVCLTKECILSAATLMESMDESADPCDDFYQFACGGWQKKNVIPHGHEGISQFSILDGRIDRFIKEFFLEYNTELDSKAINNTRDMYDACLDLNAIEELGITPLVKILDSFGQWPMTVSNWTEDRFDWRKASASIRNTFGVGFLFQVSNFVDVNDTDFSVIYVDQLSLGVPNFILRENNLTSTHVMDYFTFISAVALTVRDAIGGGAYDIDIVKDIEDMIRFHIDLANIMTLNEHRSDWNLSRIYNPFSLDELQMWTDSANATNSMGQINWYEHLTDIYSIADVSINPDEKIVVTEPEYLKKLVQLLDQTSPRVIANFIHWRLVLENIYDLNDELMIMADAFDEAIYGPFPIPSREDWCLERVHVVMGFAIGAKYVEDSFDPQTKVDMKEMILNLKMAFSSLVEDSNWMDKETKINALEKAAAMKEYIGYPDWITNRTTLELAYHGINTKQDTHFDNFQSAKRFMVKNNLRFLRFRTNRDNLWISFPAVVNAFYYPMLNSITFPAGILQPPFYGKGRLAALNYGAIGAVIGHEITHGFDDEGYKTDKKGHEISWWTNHTLTEFYKKKQCIIDQYSNYTLLELKETDAFHVNGSNTQGENIADNGGLREAFRAYQNYVARNGPEKRLPGLEHYTPEQIFFLSFATVECSNESPESLEDQVLFGVHTPSRYRVIGPLSNSDDFIQHFKCPTSSPMNPPNKCTVW